MRIGEIYGDGKFGLSIEIFPPKTGDGDQSLLATLERLAGYAPAFFSCTYGAGGSTRDRTIDWCRAIQERFGTTATAHFTCVGSTREELLNWLGRAEAAGITNIMALRGDPPQGQTEFQAVDGGLKHANELVCLIRQHHPKMGIGVAGYPEKHQECLDPKTDLENLKRKVECGADAVFTQLFYENRNFFDFRERYAAAGLSAPLVAGIMPITEFARIQRITQMCGAVFPPNLAAKLEAVQDDKEAQFEIGVEHAIRQCEELRRQGVPGIHFYVLNKPQACERIFDALGLKPAHARA
jgi:methylenetetrahydrofolate reductase (NADPH)